MSSFYNPYHFVPTPSGDNDRQGDLSVTDFKDKKTGHVTHDRYLDKAYSGRLICRLTTAGPMFIGSRREEISDDEIRDLKSKTLQEVFKRNNIEEGKRPSLVKSFELESGTPALPASSLRGLISSVAEAASNSAFRILDDTKYSRRKKIGNGYKRVDFSNAHKFFAKELIPFNSDKRNKITLAEQLFGFVEERPKGQEITKDCLALAGRLRFSFGILHPDCEDPYEGEEVLLKILDAPKPPCPSMYFKMSDGRGAYIDKNKLCVDDHRPQGRKFYLHRNTPIHPNWETRLKGPNDNLHQKSIIAPIRAKQIFYFHIDFDNLSALELGLLCYAIKPTVEFHHKLGMGKSLGLGQVCLDPVGLFLINRQERYQTKNIWQATRYYKIWVAAVDNDLVDWPEQYRREKEEWGAKKAAAGALFNDYHTVFSQGMNSDVRIALELLGNPGEISSDICVHTPQVTIRNPDDMEKETFKWFIKNNKKRKQFLKPLPLSKDSDKQPVMPTLDSSFDYRELPLMNPLETKYIFFLGGYDLEMLTIRDLLKTLMPPELIVDKGLAWGGKASLYQAGIDRALSEKYTPVLIELEDDLPVGYRERVRFIDHHGLRSGEQKSALRQVFELLRQPEDAWTRYFSLVEANDIGHIAALQKMGATNEEVRKIRDADRRCQGVLPEDEAAAREALDKLATYVDGNLSIVSIPHNKSSIVTDLIDPAYGGPGYRNLLVISPQELNFYGQGRLVEALVTEFPGGWCGGQLPRRGFWGHGTLDDPMAVKEFLLNTIKVKKVDQM